MKVDKVPYVRRLSQQSECLLLIPRNDTYPKREYKLDEVSVIGRVVGKINVSTKKI
ncbi:MAG: hypothetical protein JJV97_03640 [SAR324 cluster bacterium]|nr:hypothetical protein [SAR324 cluster bacterium]